MLHDERKVKKKRQDAWRRNIWKTIKLALHNKQNFFDNNLWMRKGLTLNSSIFELSQNIKNMILNVESLSKNIQEMTFLFFNPSSGSCLKSLADYMVYLFLLWPYDRLTCQSQCKVNFYVHVGFTVITLSIY